MSKAIVRILEDKHDLTIPNCLRYVKPCLSNFSVRKDTVVELEDWAEALELAKLELAKPLESLPRSEVTSLRPRQEGFEWKQRILNTLDKLEINGAMNKAEIELRRKLLHDHVFKDDYIRTVKIALARKEY